MHELQIQNILANSGQVEENVIVVNRIESCSVYATVCRLEICLATNSLVFRDSP